MIKVLVLTVSDRASRGEYEDKSGPAIEEMLASRLEGVETERFIVPDDPGKIKAAFGSHLDMDFIITTGGTGLSPRDVTPEVTQEFCERMIPGIAELLRNESLTQTVNAALSRGVAGVKGTTVIVNLPGSERGARFCTELLVPILLHAKDMLSGKKH